MKTQRMMVLWLGLCVLALPACGDGAEMEEHEEDPAEHACEEAAEAGAPLTAGADMAGAPTVQIGDEPYLVQLPAGSSGFVKLETDAPGEEVILFFQTTDVLAEVYDAAGEPLGIPSAGPNAQCPEDLPEHFDVDLTEAGTYFLELGPTATDEAWLLVSDAAGHVD
ncbi:MAG: hypothetical protein ACOCV4_08955 [Myxococcota bacterium]